MAIPDPEPPPPKLQLTPRRTRSASIVANSVYSFVSQLSSGVFTALLTLFLARALAPADYGVFALAVGIGALVATPADFGVSSATARFVAEQRSNPGELPALVADGVRLKLIGCVVACGALILLSGPIASAYGVALTWPIRLVAVAIAGQNFIFLFESSFVAIGQLRGYLGVALGESATECGATVAIVLLGGGVVGASVGRAIGYVFGAALALALGARTFHWPSAIRRRSSRSRVKSIARYAAPLMLVDGANALFTMVDVLLIGAFLGSRQAGLFSAPIRLLSLFFYPGIAVASGVSPWMTRGQGNTPRAGALANGLRVLLVLYALMLAPLVIWTKPIVHILLGGNYDGSVATMRLLSISVLLGGIGTLVSTSATFLGDARLRVPLMIGAALLDTVLDLILIPRIGIISGAIATAAAYAVMLVGHLAICSRHVHLPYRAIGMTTIRALVAALAMAGVLAVFGSDPSIPMLLVGGALGALVFAAVVLALGELRGAEAALVRAALRARLTGLRS